MYYALLEPISVSCFSRSPGATHPPTNPGRWQEATLLLRGRDDIPGSLLSLPDTRMGGVPVIAGQA